MFARKHDHMVQTSYPNVALYAQLHYFKALSATYYLKLHNAMTIYYRSISFLTNKYHIEHLHLVKTTGIA